jgi:hypothetical protein
VRGARALWYGLSQQADQCSDDAVTQGSKFGDGRLRKVLEFRRETNETFCLGGGSKRDPEVPSEQEWCPEGVTFYDVGLDRDRGTSELVEQRP